MKVPLLDLKPQYAAIRDDVRRAIDEVCDSQYFILGPKVAAFEAEVAAYCEATGACGVSSGSDALLAALMAEGVGVGDEVVTSAYTFFATAGAIARLGATPVFADIDPDTLNIDPAGVAAALTPQTKAIIPVHLFGQPADMDPIMKLADERGLVVIEDAAQAIGAEYRGRRVGAIGHYGCFSFFPSKNLGAYGDGGMVTTGDPERVERLAVMRNHGASPKYYHALVGGNFRLDALQAAVLSVKLKHLDAWHAAREANAEDYGRLFRDSPVADVVRLPVRAPFCTRHVYNQFCIRVQAAVRDPLRAALRAADIGCEVYYPVPLHLQACFGELGYSRGDFPESERAADESLALPIYPESTHEQRVYVVATIAQFLSQALS